MHAFASFRLHRDYIGSEVHQKRRTVRALSPQIDAEQVHVKLHSAHLSEPFYQELLKQ